MAISTITCVAWHTIYARKKLQESLTLSKSEKVVFLSYAHADANLAREFASALKPLERTGEISVWMDERIPAGTVWRREILHQLANSDVIVLLLSAHYLASEYCWGTEMKTALDNQQTGRSHVVPVILQPCDWRSTPLANFQVLPKDGRPVSQWRDRAKALSEIVAELRGVLARPPLPPQIPIAAQQSEAPVTHSAVWNVPYPRDAAFVGRQVELAKVHEMLQRSSGQRKPLIINGLAGVGKTALAIEYAYRFGNTYSAVWWTRANHRDVFAEDLALLAQTPGLAHHESDLQYSVALARDWLARNRGWLLICDDIQDQGILDFFDSPNGMILATSRMLAWRGKVDIFSLMPLSAAEVQRMISAAGLRDPQVSREMVEALGGNPLACRMATAYLQRHPSNTGRETLTESFGAALAEGQTAISKVLEAVLSDLKKQPVAMGILNLSAFIADGPVPVDLFYRGMRALWGHDDTAFSEEVFRQAIEQMAGLSLIGHSKSVLIFHGLVQQFIRSKLDPVDRDVWLKSALKLLVDSFPNNSSDSESQHLCSMLLPHAYAALSHCESNKVDQEFSVLLLLKVGIYFSSRGELADAQRCYSRALDAVYKIGMAGSTVEAIIHQHLGAVYEQLGNLQSAVSEYERGLAIALDSPDKQPDVGLGLFESLARVAEAVGRLDESNLLYERGLDFAAKYLGDDHNLRARLLAQLAGVLRKKGQLEPAREILEQGINLAQSQSGPRSDDALLGYRNLLGTILVDSGDFRGAQKCFEKVLEGARQRGDQATEATVLNNLGTTYRALGAIDQAISFFTEALSINERLQDRNPQSMGMTLKNLGESLLQENRFQEAQRFLKLALQMLERAYGPSHNACRDVSRELALGAEARE